MLCCVGGQVEDIIDSGHTLDRLARDLRAAGAASVKVCALLDKKGRRRVEFHPDYVGFEVGEGGRGTPNMYGIQQHAVREALGPSRLV